MSNVRRELVVVVFGRFEGSFDKAYYIIDQLWGKEWSISISVVWSRHAAPTNPVRIECQTIDDVNEIMRLLNDEELARDLIITDISQNRL